MSEMFEYRFHMTLDQIGGDQEVGRVHMHAKKAFSVGRIHRSVGESLCGRKGFFERTPYDFETDLCQRCVTIANRVFEEVVPTREP